MEHNEQPNRIYFEWAERIFCSSSGVAPRGILGASPRSALGAPPSALPSAELFSQLPSGPSPEQPPELFLWAFPGALRSLEPYPESIPGAPSAQLPDSLPGAPASTSSSPEPFLGAVPSQFSESLRGASRPHSQAWSHSRDYPRGAPWPTPGIILAPPQAHLLARSNYLIRSRSNYWPSSRNPPWGIPGRILAPGAIGNGPEGAPGNGSSSCSGLHPRENSGMTPGSRMRPGVPRECHRGRSGRCPGVVPRIALGSRKRPREFPRGNSRNRARERPRARSRAQSSSRGRFWRQSRSKSQSAPRVPSQAHFQPRRNPRNFPGSNFAGGVLNILPWARN